MANNILAQAIQLFNSGQGSQSIGGGPSPVEIIAFYAASGDPEAVGWMPYVAPYLSRYPNLDQDSSAPGVQIDGKTVPFSTGGQMSANDPGQWQGPGGMNDPEAKINRLVTNDQSAFLQSAAQKNAGVGGTNGRPGSNPAYSTEAYGNDPNSADPNLNDTITPMGAASTTGVNPADTPGSSQDLSGTWLDGLTDVAIGELNPAQDPEGFLKMYLGLTRGEGFNDPYANANEENLQDMARLYPMLLSSGMGDDVGGSLEGMTNADTAMYFSNYYDKQNSADGTAMDPRAALNVLWSDQNLGSPAFTGDYAGEGASTLDTQVDAVTSQIASMGALGASDAWMSAVLSNVQQAADEYKILAAKGQTDGLSFGQWAKKYKGADQWL